MKYLFTLVCLFCAFGLTAQTDCVFGRVVEQDSTTVLPFASITVHYQGKFVAGSTTDLNGVFKICGLPKNKKVTLEIHYTGYKMMQYTNMPVGEDLKNLIMSSSDGVALDVITVSAYKVPLIQQDQTTSGQTLTSEQIRRLPRRQRKARRSAVAGLSGRQKGQGINVRGSHSNSTDYYIDGVRVIKDREKNEGYNKIVENTFLKTKKDPVSTLSTDVDRAAYANVRRFLNNGNLPPVDAVRTEELINYFHYTDVPPKKQDEVALRTEIMPCPWNDKNHLLRVSVKTMPLTTENIPASNLVFLLDVSGSMNSENKLGLVKQSLTMLTGSLRSEDKVSIVVYAGAAGVVLSPVSGSNKTAITNALEKLSAGGSTAGGQGIQLAYKLARENFIPDGNNRIILATDGDFNVGISGREALVKLIEKERKSGVYLTVLGFGTGNYQGGKMQELADRGNGNHAYIDGIAEAKKVLVEEFGGTLFTVAKDVKLQLEFKPEAIAAYRLIGYENRLLNDEDFVDDTKDAAEMGAGHSVTVLYEMVPAKGFTTLPNYGFLRLRYKPAEGGRSQKLAIPIMAGHQASENTSTDIRWAAAVAEFGMLLRGSKYIGGGSWAHCRKMAQNALGKDTNGRRGEFLELLTKAEKLASARK